MLDLGYHTNYIEVRINRQTNDLLGVLASFTRQLQDMYNCICFVDKVIPEESCKNWSVEWNCCVVTHHGYLASAKVVKISDFNNKETASRGDFFAKMHSQNSSLPMSKIGFYIRETFS